MILFFGGHGWELDAFFLFRSYLPGSDFDSQTYRALPFSSFSNIAIVRDERSETTRRISWIPRDSSARACKPWHVGPPASKSVGNQMSWAVKAPEMRRSALPRSDSEFSWGADEKVRQSTSSKNLRSPTRLRKSGTSTSSQFCLHLRRMPRIPIPPRSLLSSNCDSERRSPSRKKCVATGKPAACKIPWFPSQKYQTMMTPIPIGKARPWGRRPMSYTSTHP